MRLVRAIPETGTEDLRFYRLDHSAGISGEAFVDRPRARGPDPSGIGIPTPLV